MYFELVEAKLLSVDRNSSFAIGGGCLFMLNTPPSIYEYGGLAGTSYFNIIKSNLNLPHFQKKREN